jgi:hypothetical protein
MLMLQDLKRRANNQPKKEVGSANPACHNGPGGWPAGAFASQTPTFSSGSVIVQGCPRCRPGGRRWLPKRGGSPAVHQDGETPRHRRRPRPRRAAGGHGAMSVSRRGVYGRGREACEALLGRVVVQFGKVGPLASGYPTKGLNFDHQ